MAMTVGDTTMAVPVTSTATIAVLIVVVVRVAVSVVVTLNRNGEREAVRLIVHTATNRAVEEDTSTNGSSIELVIPNVAVVKQTSFAWTVLLAYSLEAFFYLQLKFPIYVWCCSHRLTSCQKAETQN